MKILEGKKVDISGKGKENKNLVIGELIVRKKVSRTLMVKKTIILS